MPEALASRRGAALNCRFAVNGIQKFSRLGALVLVSIVSSYLGVAGHALRRATSPFLQNIKSLFSCRVIIKFVLYRTSETGREGLMSIDIGGRLRYVRMRQ